MHGSMNYFRCMQLFVLQALFVVYLEIYGKNTFFQNSFFKHLQYFQLCLTQAKSFYLEMFILVKHLQPNILSLTKLGPYNIYPW